MARPIKAKQMMDEEMAQVSERETAGWETGQMVMDAPGSTPPMPKQCLEPALFREDRPRSFRGGQDSPGEPDPRLLTMGGVLAKPDDVDTALKEFAEKDRKEREESAKRPAPVVEKQSDAPKGLTLNSPRVLENIALMVLNSMGITKERMGDHFYTWLDTAHTYVEEEFATNQLEKSLKVIGKGMWDAMKIDRIRCMILLTKTLEYTLNSVEE